LGAPVVRTHRGPPRYQPATELYPWIDLQPDGLIAACTPGTATTGPSRSPRTSGSPSCATPKPPDLPRRRRRTPPRSRRRAPRMAVQAARRAARGSRVVRAVHVANPSGERGPARPGRNRDGAVRLDRGDLLGAAGEGSVARVVLGVRTRLGGGAAAAGRPGRRTVDTSAPPRSPAPRVTGSGSWRRTCPGGRGPRLPLACQASRSAAARRHTSKATAGSTSAGSSAGAPRCRREPGQNNPDLLLRQGSSGRDVSTHSHDAAAWCRHRPASSSSANAVDEGRRGV